MKCPNCSSEIEREWMFCPHCGLRTVSMNSFFDFPALEGLFENIDKEFERMRKRMNVDESSFMRPHTSGVSIRISSAKGKQPKVEVRTFGDYKGEEGEIIKRLGVESGKEETASHPSREMPKEVEEPKTDVKRIGNSLILTVKVPGVRDIRDVDVRALEESIEVRAYATGKAYFTLFPLPPGATVVNKFLEKEELTIELEI